MWHKREGVLCTCDHYERVDQRLLIIKLDAMGDVLRSTALLARTRFLAEVWALDADDLDADEIRRGRTQLESAGIDPNRSIVGLNHGAGGRWRSNSGVKTAIGI